MSNIYLHENDLIVQDVEKFLLLKNAIFKKNL